MATIRDGWSAALARGGSVYLMLGRITLANMNTRDPAELDRKLAPFPDDLEHHRTVLRPEAAEGRLQEFMLGDIARELHKPVKALPVHVDGDRHGCQHEQDGQETASGPC
ncbi:MAG: hypothetical protein AB1758_08785 [Candidatus Eremiobacterota bacterium]